MVRLIVKLTRAAFDGSLGDLAGWVSENDLSSQQELLLTILLGIVLAVLVAGLTSILAVAIDTAMPLDQRWLLENV